MYVYIYIYIHERFYMFLLFTRSSPSGSAFLAISSFYQVPCTWTSSLIFQATVASPTLWPQRGHRPGWQTRQIVIQRFTEVKGLKKLDDILLKWLAEYTRQGLKGLKTLARGLRGRRIWKIPVPGSRFRAPMLDDAGCVFVLHKYKESYLFGHVCTYPLQNYSDDVSICLMYIWSSKEVGMSKLPSYGQIENDEGWCAIETWNDEGWCARETWSWCNWLWWRVVREWDLTMMKGGARCNNTSCVNTSEKNWLWWRVVRDVTIHHVSIHQKRIDYDEGWWARRGSGEEGKWWWRGVVKKGGEEGKWKWWRRDVMMKGSGEEGKWWGREVVRKGSGEEGEWWRREVVRKGSGEEGNWWGREVVIWGGSQSTKPCVFPCKVAAGDDERYLVCAAVAAAVVPDAIGSSYGFCKKLCSCVRSSMRFLKLCLQIALEWLHECCMGYVVGRKPEHETLCFSV